jgi:hypothetical protein
VVEVGKLFPADPEQSVCRDLVVETDHTVAVPGHRVRSRAASSPDSTPCFIRGDAVNLLKVQPARTQLREAASVPV